MDTVQPKSDAVKVTSSDALQSSKGSKVSSPKGIGSDKGGMAPHPDKAERGLLDLVYEFLDFLKMIFGEMGELLLLKGQRVIPSRLQEAGYQFQHPNIAAALQDLMQG